MTMTYTDDYLIEAIQPAPEMTAKVNPELMTLRFSIPRWGYAAASNTSWKKDSTAYTLREKAWLLYEAEVYAGFFEAGDTISYYFRMVAL
jgi:hypothetical protein